MAGSNCKATQVSSMAQLDIFLAFNENDVLPMRKFAKHRKALGQMERLGAVVVENDLVRLDRPRFSFLMAK